jgi:hypothetical protein
MLIYQGQLESSSMEVSVDILYGAFSICMCQSGRRVYIAIAIDVAILWGMMA